MHCLWTRTRCAARSRLAATCRVRSPPWWKRVLSARLRVQDAIEKETTLNILMQQRQQSDTSSERIDAIAAQRQLPACLVPQYLTDLYTLAVTDTSPHLPFTIRLKQLCDRVRPPRVIHDQPQSPPPPPCVCCRRHTPTPWRHWGHARCVFRSVQFANGNACVQCMQFQSLPEDAVLERASYAAEYCWLTLRRDPWADRLTPDDLRATMGTEALTQMALRTFDVDGDGNVDESELHERLRARYKCAAPRHKSCANAWSGMRVAHACGHAGSGATSP